MSYDMGMDGLGGVFDFSAANFAEMSQAAGGVLVGASIANFVTSKTKEWATGATAPGFLKDDKGMPNAFANHGGTFLPILIGIGLHNAANGQNPVAALWMKSGAAGMIGFGIGKLLKDFLPANPMSPYIALGATDNYEFGYAGSINRYLNPPNAQVVNTANGLGRAPGLIMSGFAAAPSTAEVVATHGLHGLSATLM